jgi:hypothetical protein
MTRWLIGINTNTRAEDTKIFKLLQQAGKLGLTYTITSKEITVEEPIVNLLHVDERA